jgi:hypothetical protein
MIPVTAATRNICKEYESQTIKITFLKQPQESLSLNNLKSRLCFCGFADEIEVANCKSANDIKRTGPQIANPHVATFAEGPLI